MNYRSSRSRRKREERGGFASGHGDEEGGKERGGEEGGRGREGEKESRFKRDLLGSSELGWLSVCWLPGAVR